MVERSKDALDKIYKLGTSESERVSNALEVYGSEKFADEFKFCIDEIIKVCNEGNEGKPKKLRDIIFKKSTNNAFPSVFASLLIAFHELIVKKSKKITNYAVVRRDIKDTDMNRIKDLDGIEPKQIGKRFIVGVIREAKVLGLPVGKYFSKWKDAIKNSEMSLPLKNSVLSNMDFNSFYGLGIIVITIPPQKELSYVGEELYWRNSDSTELAKTPKQIATLAQRF